MNNDAKEIIFEELENPSFGDILAKDLSRGKYKDFIDKANDEYNRGESLDSLKGKEK